MIVNTLLYQELKRLKRIQPAMPASERGGGKAVETITLE